MLVRLAPTAITDSSGAAASDVKSMRPSRPAAGGSSASGEASRKLWSISCTSGSSAVHTAPSFDASADGIPSLVMRPTPRGEIRVRVDIALPPLPPGEGWVRGCEKTRCSSTSDAPSPLPSPGGRGSEVLPRPKLPHLHRQREPVRPGDHPYEPPRLRPLHVGADVAEL